MTRRPFPLFDCWGLMLKSPPEWRYIPRAICYSTLLAVQQPFHWLEMLIWQRRIQAHQLDHPPVFILGYWRSGTTYLQRLLAQNPQLAYLEQFEALMPLGTAIHSPVTRPFARWLFKVTGAKHPSHGVPMKVDFPSEEAILFCTSSYPHTCMQSHVYSRKAEEYMDKYLILEENSKEFNRFVRVYEYLVRRLSYFKKNRPLVLKSPPNTAKVRELIAAFPEAKFIYIERNPEDVYHSNIKLFKNNKAQWMQRMPESQMQSMFIDTYPKVMKQYQDTKHLIPEENLVELKFENLIADPVEKIKLIYDQLGLPGWEEQLPILKDYIKQHHGKKRHIYEREVPEAVRAVLDA